MLEQMPWLYIKALRLSVHDEEQSTPAFAYLTNFNNLLCTTLLQHLVVLSFRVHMSVDIQPPELTLADMLRIHRAWITSLFVDQRKTDVEIVQLLYERHIRVS